MLGLKVRASWCVALVATWQFAQVSHAEVYNTYDGPSFSATVQRGDVSLPLLQVDHLQKGDRIQIIPSAELASHKDWVIVLASISRSGTDVSFKANSVQDEQRFELEVPASDAVPAIVIAPALRTFFGITTSTGESTDLIEQAIRTDPQRFVSLQKIDQISQAARALADVLSAVPVDQGPEAVSAAARSAAARYGLPTVGPNCVKSTGVDIQCLAAEIVNRASLDAMSADKLGSITGKPDQGKLPGQLDDSIKTFTAAADYFTSRYRDLYDFTPTFARSGDKPEEVKLYAIDRYRNGGIKTAYVYVPAWFQGPMPALAVDGLGPVCMTSGHIPLRTGGRLPLSNYWHDWHLDLSDTRRQPVGAAIDIPSMHPEFGEIRVPIDPALAAKGSTVLTGRFSGMLGFQALTLPDVSLALPVTHDLDDALEGGGSLVAGEMAHLRIASGAGYCVTQMKLMAGGRTLATSAAGAPSRLDVDLSTQPAGPAALVVSQAGVPDQVMSVSIVGPRVRIRSLVHQDGDDFLTAEGTQLDRLDHVQLGGTSCTPRGAPQRLLDTPYSRLVLSCGQPLSNATLPDRANVFHVGGQPAAQMVSMTKGEARPSFQLARSGSALVVQPSDKAVRWGLAHDPAFSTDDSGLAFVLQATNGYALRSGGYLLQLRISEDTPVSDTAPFSVPLMVNRARGELRTRSPVVFPSGQLPTVVNHLQFRVVRASNGLAGDWQDLPHAIVLLPSFKSVSCDTSSSRWWVHGDHLDMVEGVGHPGGTPSDFWPAPLSQCDDGACFELREWPADHRLAVKVAWVDQPFVVQLPDPGACAAQPGVAPAASSP
ncbi:MAG TPA: hypothetical protein VFM48_03435 [Aquabacterium sp.]|nr:hypothetical protein [Aquabacterium sp.]